MQRSLCNWCVIQITTQHMLHIVFFASSSKWEIESDGGAEHLNIASRYCQQRQWCRHFVVRLHKLFPSLLSETKITLTLIPNMYWKLTVKSPEWHTKLWNRPHSSFILLGRSHPLTSLSLSSTGVLGNDDETREREKHQLILSSLCARP